MKLISNASGEYPYSFFLYTVAVGTAHIEGGARETAHLGEGGGALTGGGAPRPEGVAGSEGGVKPAHMEGQRHCEQVGMSLYRYFKKQSDQPGSSG